MKKSNLWKFGLVVIGIAAMLMFACGDDGGGGDPGGNGGKDFDIAGTYTFSQATGQNTLVYTWVFKEDKTYEITRSIGSTTNTGKWSVSGKNITLEDTSSQNAVMQIKETFAISENGDKVTLTFSGSLSSIFVSYFSIATETSINITRKGGSSGDNGENNEKPSIPFLARQVTAGSCYTLAIKTDGSLWAWGRNYYGQLGDGTQTDKNTPTRIGTDTNWASVSASIDSNHIISIKTDGTLWAWGDNSSGQLGDGTTTNKNIPTKIGEDTNWAFVSAGFNHTVAIKTDGTLWAWGSNSSGGFGDGTTTNKNIPTKIGEETNWAFVSASRNTVAIKKDDSLWGWGYNYYGQLGDGTKTNRNTPIRIESDTNWVSVFAGAWHTVAIKTDGTLWAWGYNNYGQLGDGTNIERLVPTKIVTDTSWVSFFAGREHTVALKTNGSLWAWGNNSSGQLGDGTWSRNEFNNYINNDKSIPTRIGSETNWTSVSAGYNHTVAIKTDNSLWTWGDSGYGSDISTIPTQVFYYE